MSSAQEFSDTVRTGGRAGSPTVVAHVLPSSDGAGTPVHIGFIVNKSVGNAVVRNRVRRRLRHLCQPLADELSPATRVVVRALPSAATAGSGRLADDLRATVQRATAKAERVGQA